MTLEVKEDYKIVYNQEVVGELYNHKYRERVYDSLLEHDKLVLLNKELESCAESYECELADNKATIEKLTDDIIDRNDRIRKLENTIFKLERELTVCVHTNEELQDKLYKLEYMYCDN